MADYTIAFSELNDLLQGFNENSSENPYKIEVTNLTVSDLGYSSDSGSLGNVLKNNSDKFVDLSDTELPSGLETLENSFSGCSNLVKAPNIPESVVNLKKAFKDCTSLTSTPAILGNVTNMNGTFFGCSSLLSVLNIPRSVTNLSQAFKNCTSLSEAPIFSAEVGSLYETFKNCSSLTAMPIIPPEVTSLNSTFEGCSNLTITTTIPNSVTNMNSTFKGCSSLVTSPSIPSSVTNLNNTFEDCYSLINISPISSSATNLNSTFKNCASLTDLSDFIIPSSVTNLEHTFEGCSDLLIIPAIPENVIGLVGTFKNCTSLITVSGLSENIIDMSDAFNGCISLTTLSDFPNEVVDLSSAFYDCSSLVNVPKVPSGVLDLSNAFYGCSSLESIFFSSSDFSEIDLSGVFVGCSSLEKIFIVSEEAKTSLAENISPLQQTRGPAVGDYPSDLNLGNALRVRSSETVNKTLVITEGTQEFENKIIDAEKNTLTGVATTDEAQEFTNKTIDKESNIIRSSYTTVSQDISPTTADVSRERTYYIDTYYATIRLPAGNTTYSGTSITIQMSTADIYGYVVFDNHCLCLGSAQTLKMTTVGGAWQPESGLNLCLYDNLIEHAPFKNPSDESQGRYLPNDWRERRGLTSSHCVYQISGANTTTYGLPSGNCSVEVCWNTASHGSAYCTELAANKCHMARIINNGVWENWELITTQTTGEDLNNKTLWNCTLNTKSNLLKRETEWYSNNAFPATLTSSDIQKERTLGFNVANQLLTIGNIEAPYKGYTLPILFDADSYVRYNSVWGHDVIFWLKTAQSLTFKYVWSHQWIIKDTGNAFYLLEQKKIDNVLVNDWRKMAGFGTYSYFYGYSGAASDYDLPDDNCVVEVTWAAASDPKAAKATATKWAAGAKHVWEKSYQSDSWDSQWTEIITSNNISNCITQIHQDINLTLSDGVVTLKANSKIYIPNGFENNDTTKPIFETYTIPEDKIITRTSTYVADWLVSIRKQGDVYNMQTDSLNNVYSGDSAPSSQTYMIWYDTQSNKIKTTSDGGSTWNEGWALPLGIVTTNTTQIGSIKTVFNGFGYIGSTCFALPGLKALGPNGRNSDGSLKSNVISYTQVKTVTASGNGSHILALGGQIYDVDISTWKYNEQTNLFDYHNDNTRHSTHCIAATYTATSGKISNFKPNTVFHVMDYNDKDVVWVTYDITTYNEITTLRNAGKEILCSYNGATYRQTSASSNEYFFTCLSTYAYSNQIKVTNQNVWSNYSKNIVFTTSNQDLTNKTIDANNNTLKNVVTSKNITNCITEIPQDINLTLSSGTLTSNGTKVWYPYGTSAPTLSIGSSLNGGTITAISWDNAKLFYQVSLPTITQTSFGSLTSDIFLFARDTGTYFEYAQPSTVTSGTTPPSSGVFYNTSTNIISYYESGSILRTGISLPIALCHRTSGTMDRINQVLNGMGYIGSTCFVLPGLKALSPNGRNSDGSLRSAERNTTSVLTVAGSATGTMFLYLTAALGLMTVSGYYYDEVENSFISNSTGNKSTYTILATINSTAGVISNFVPRTVYHGIDWSDERFNYSTGEIRTTEKWIDGKPIYRKTVTFTNSADQSAVSTSIGVSNINEILKYEGFSKTSSGIFVPINYYNGTNYACCQADTANISYQSSFTGLASRSVYVTLYYTKTTD